MNGISNIIKKELTRVFKDKKLVINLFILPVVLIIGLYILIGKMQSSMEHDIKEHISNIVVQDAPEEFKDFFTTINMKMNIQYIDGSQSTEEVKAAIKKGTTDTLVEFEVGFIEKIQNYKEGDSAPEIKTYYNPSEEYSKSARDGFLELAITPYQKKLLADRIGNLDNIIVFNVDTNPENSIVMDKEKASGKALGMLLPYFITMLLFAGAMGLGVDAITGEKERGTLASMLITPIKRSEIVMGKLISLSILSCLSAMVYAVSMVITMPMMLGSLSGQDANLAVKFSFVQIIQLLVIMLTLVFLYVTIVSLVAVFARTSKEASTYVTPMYIIVIVAGLITMFQSGETSLVSYFIPIYGSAVSMQALLAGELTNMQFLATIGGTVGSSVILTWIITSAFNSEKVMFNA